MTHFEIALRITMGYEGGFSNDPEDRGGATMWGITQAVYNSYRRSRGEAEQDVRLITLEEKKHLYYRDYWLAAKCDKIPFPMNVAHFDMAVNNGKFLAWKIMQRALGVYDDGLPGPQTFGAFVGKSLDDLLWKWIEHRTDLYVAIVRNNSSQLKFLRGWLKNRVIFLHRELRRLVP